MVIKEEKRNNNILKKKEIGQNAIVKEKIYQIVLYIFIK